MDLEDLGWDAEFAAAAEAAGRPDARPGRVARVDMGLVTVWTEDETVRAVPSAGSVATGDWVLIETVDDTTAVTEILPRRSVFTRGNPMEGAAIGEQVLAANIDTVFIVHSLNNKPNLRRLERELVLVYESGATPVLVLTKADLAVDPDGYGVEFATVAPGVDIIITSAIDGSGVDDLRHYAVDQTVALIGASGVGKSTLVNMLVGEDVQLTQEVREGDQRGRHTTTARELVVLPGGGVLVDTPGLRAVSLWDADEGMAIAFADVEELIAKCKFSDCSHRTEPGCAVRAALESGELDRQRFENYQRLDQELDAAARKREGRIMSKAIRKMYKRGL